MLASLDDESKSNAVYDDSDGFSGFGDDYMVNQGKPTNECDFSGDDIMVYHSVGYDNGHRGNGDLDEDVGIVDDSDMGTKQPAVALLIL